MKPFLTLIFALAITVSRGQNCPQEPAPCPHDAEIENNKDVAVRTKDNDNLPQDMQMEDRVRSAATAEVKRIARTHGWDVYELTEQGISNPYIFITGWDWNNAPAGKRSPHRFRVSFIFVINRDSLAAWKTWLQTDLQQRNNDLMQTYQADAAANAPLLQQYQDSVQYYMEQYAKAFEAHDPKAKTWMDKADRASAKMGEIQNGSRSTKASNDFTGYADKTAFTFAEGSLALVCFDFNPYQADRHMEGTEAVVSIPRASYASITTNKVKPTRNNYNPNYNAFAFESPSCGALVLFGSYQTRDPQYGTYRCTFAKNYRDSKSTIGDVKAVAEDKVQNIAINIQGRNDKVATILRSFDWGAIDKLRAE